MLRRLTSTRALHLPFLAATLLVSLAQLHAQNYAKVVVQSGTVNILKDASGYSFAAMVKDEVQPGYVIKTGPDGYAKIQVPDGSTFEVFKNSEVQYLKTNSIEDLINVWLGKVKVVIQHLKGVPNPNNVITPTALISVRGTVFDVDVEDADGTTLVVLDEGEVNVSNLKKGGRAKLVPGQAIRVYPDQPLQIKGDHNAFYKAVQIIRRAGEDYIYSRPGGGPGGGGTAPSGGNQGDNGKGKTTGTGTGSAPAPGTGTGTAPAPPPPPPGGGGGGD